MSKIVERAQSYGSKATTREGAKRYLMGQIKRDETPLYKRGYKGSSWKIRNHKTRRYEVRACKIASALKLITRDDADELAEHLCGLKAAKVSVEYNYPYRRSHSGWAGGDHTVWVALSERPYCRGRSEKVWSSNGKWSGTDSFSQFEVTARALMVAPNLLIHGHVVLDAEPIPSRPGDFHLIVAVQGRGFGLNSADAYLLTGKFIIAKSLKSAMLKIAKTVSNRLQNAV